VLYVDGATAKSLIKEKAVGDMVARYFDGKGSPINNQLEDRMLGINFKQLKKVPRVLVVANGVEKSKALAGALHIGIITDLFVDEDLANSILQEWE
jgi:deoxyribonucleoside regulator